MSSELWKGLRSEAREVLETRDYSKAELAQRVAAEGVGAGELVGVGRDEPWWIPGVEVFERRIFAQRQRGWFGEFARMEEGCLADIGMWPRQWATATMFAGTAKGFHIHPPYIPEGEDPGEWLAGLFSGDGGGVAMRPYDKEQWDAMFFVQGKCEMFLVDERIGFPRKRMRFVIAGDDCPGPDNVGVVIPPGVAHGLLSSSSKDLIMVYGTSTKFHPEAEGRLVSGVERARIPSEWEGYFS